MIIAESERKSNHEAPSGQSETETAYWNNSQVSGGSTYPSDSEGLPVSMLEAESPQELIQILNSRKDPDAKLALNKLNTKVVKSGKGINWEFNGRLLDLVKGDIPINENDADNVKISKAQKNAKTRKSRTSWRDLNEF